MRPKPTSSASRVRNAHNNSWRRYCTTDAVGGVPPRWKRRRYAILVRHCRTRNAPMTTLTIRLDEKLDKALERLAKTTGRSKSDLAREALKRQVAVARFRELR